MPRNPHEDDEQDPDLRRGGSGLGVAALVMGVLGILFFPIAVGALVCGILGLKNRGKGMAIAGIVLGSLGLTLFPIMILAAIAIPYLLESRVQANENAARSSLKTVHAAQVTYQSGAYSDADGDGLGEAGGLRQLVAQGMLGEEFVAGGSVNGYRFAIWIPDGRGAAVQSSAELPVDACKDAERYFIAYAWPQAYGDSGRKIFAVTHHGMVLQAPLDTQGEPAWDAALGSGASTGDRFRNPTWTPARH